MSAKKAVSTAVQPVGGMLSRFANRANPRVPAADPSKLWLGDRVCDGNLGQTVIIKNKRGELVGTDKFGNQYMQDKPEHKEKWPMGFGNNPVSGAQRSRWVVYADHEDYYDAPTAVPPEWHGWLNWVHPTVCPTTGYADTKPWFAIDPEYNVSGSDEAYCPRGAFKHPGNLMTGK